MRLAIGFFALRKKGHHLAKFSIGTSGVDITSGRGKAKVTLTVDFSTLDEWAKKMKNDTTKLMQQSFANACSGLKKKFLQVVQNAGGVCGVPKFKDFDEFTQQLRMVDGTSNRRMGGKLAEKNSIGAWKRNGWQIIGWKDFLANYAVYFQDAIPNGADERLNDNQWRRYLHIKGIKEIPRTYTQNQRQIIPEPFGEYVKEHLEEWAKGSFYKELAKQMQKASVAK